MLQSYLQHFFRKIHTDHVIAFPGQQPCEFSGTAAKIQYQTVLHTILFQKTGHIITPGPVGDVIHEQIVHGRKTCICLHV